MQLSDFASRLPFPCHLVHDSKAAADLELWNHPKLDSALVFLLNRNLGGAVITNHSVHQGFPCTAVLWNTSVWNRMVQSVTAEIAAAWKPSVPPVHWNCAADFQ